MIAGRRAEQKDDSHGDGVQRRLRPGLADEGSMRAVAGTGRHDGQQEDARARVLAAHVRRVDDVSATGQQLEGLP